MNVRELARGIGLSHMTVSRALNGSPNVAPGTREKVLRAADRHGYSIHASARELATGITNTIGILYPHHALRSVESWYTSQLMHDVRVTIGQSGFDAIVAGYDTASRGSEDIARLCSQRKADAIIVLGHEVTEEALETLAERRYRFLCVNPPNEPWAAGHPALMVDQALGGELAAQALRDAGCRRAAVVCETSAQFRARVEGFTKRWGCAVEYHTLADGSYRTAYQTAEERFELLRGYDGLFVGSDVSAIGVMNALQDAGVDIPREVSVCGYDDIDAAAYCRPALTTVRQPRREISEGVLGWLTALRASFAGPRRRHDRVKFADSECSSPAAAVLTPSLIVRQSVHSEVQLI